MNKTSSFGVLSLFSSLSTLVCCALPALFVSLGAGATFASLVTHVPQLIWLSENKLLVFSIAGVLLLVSGIWQWRAKNLPCPIDPELARACARARKQSLVIYIISLIVFMLGGFFAFVLPAL